MKNEAKKAYWQKVSGYMTPGGDSVWKCPICGKGEHVYGIEHTKNFLDKCPECKIKLKYF